MLLTISPSMKINWKEIPKTSKLYLDFLYDFSKVARFYAGDYQKDSSYRKLLLEIDQRSYPREKIASILQRQNLEYGCSQETLKNIDLLTKDDSYLVLTGQQVGIFGGPLYTFYKALCAVKIAKWLSQKFKKNFIPLFGLASDDHDLSEVNFIQVIDQDNQLKKIEYLPQEDDWGKSMSRIILSENIQQTIKSFDSATFPTEFKSGVFDRLKECYQEGEKITFAFGKWMTYLLKNLGLVFFDFSDQEFKRLAQSIFEREIEEAGGSTELVEKTNEKLESAGYHLQVIKTADFLNLFLHNEKRERIKLQKGDLILDKIEKKLSQEELKEILKKEPERISPNVLLKPVVQSFVFPVSVYVAGPGEVAYYAQIKRVFEHFNVLMPIVYTRASLTLVENKIRAIMEKCSISPHLLLTDAEKVINEVMKRNLPEKLEEKFSKTKEEIQYQIDILSKELETFEPSLRKTLELSLGKIDYELKELEKKVFQAYKKRNSILTNQIYKAKINLFPDGKLQERQLSILPYLIKYGFKFIDFLYENIDIQSKDHQLLDVVF
jgi:bacillithiol biosynthesis cysteine-adding enzyme BshC